MVESAKEPEGVNFDSLLSDAVRSTEIQRAVADTTALSEASLHQAASDARSDLAAQARLFEEEYRAVDPAVAAETRHRRVRNLAVVGWVLLGFIVLSVGFANSLDTQMRAAYSARPPTEVNGWAVFGLGLAIVVFLLGPAAVLGLLAWVISALVPAVRRGEPAAERGRVVFIVWFTGLPHGILMLLLTVFNVSSLTWLVTHRQSPPTAPPAPGWTFLVIIAVGAVYIGGWVLVTKGATANVGPRITPSVVPASIRAEKLQAWHSALADAIMVFLREHINKHVDRRYRTTLELPTGATGLRQVRGRTSHVRTPADDQLTVIAAGMGGGSIALTGPRGMGKTELLDQFCIREPGNVGLVVNVPVVFDRREFMLYLFAEVCELADSHGILPKLAKARLDWIQYLQTRSTERNAGVGIRTITVGAKRGENMARQPLTYPRDRECATAFLSQVAHEVQQRGQRLVIGVDELDRIEPIDRARDFLNELKAVFEVSDCVFVLSVSNEALQDANLARRDHRDAFDSAIDEVVTVAPLSYAYALRLLDQRAIGIPEPFVALFHCLSGGSPRNLLRIARAAVTQLSSQKRHRSPRSPRTSSTATVAGASTIRTTTPSTTHSAPSSPTT